MKFIALDPKNQPEMDRLSNTLWQQGHRYWAEAMLTGAAIQMMTVPFPFRVEQ